MFGCKEMFLLCVDKYDQQKLNWMEGNWLGGKLLANLAKMVEKSFLDYKIATYFCIHDNGSSQEDISNALKTMETMQTQYKTFVGGAIQDQFDFLTTL